MSTELSPQGWSIRGPRASGKVGSRLMGQTWWGSEGRKEVDPRPAWPPFPPGGSSVPGPRSPSVQGRGALTRSGLPVQDTH